MPPKYSPEDSPEEQETRPQPPFSDPTAIIANYKELGRLYWEVITFFALWIYMHILKLLVRLTDPKDKSKTPPSDSDSSGKDGLPGRDAPKA